MTEASLNAITERKNAAQMAEYRRHTPRVVVFGANGLAGSAIVRKFRDVGFDVYEITHDICDASDFQNVCWAFDRLHKTPDMVVNCIAYSSVDLKNNEEARKSYLSNQVAPFNIGKACIRFKVPLFIHISTDYVFNNHDGLKISQDCQRYSPANAYGIFKLAGDMSLVGLYDNWNFRNEDDPLKLRIVRTSSLYGPDRNTFVDYVVDQYRNNGTIKALVTGSSTPTSTRYLAEYIHDLFFYEIGKKEDIVNHLRYFKNCVCSNTLGNISRFRFASYIVDCLKKLNVPGGLKIEPARDFDFPALRPQYSQLEPNTEYNTPPDWLEELFEFLQKKA